MTPSTLHQSVILLLDERQTTHEVDNWLAESRFSTYEALNVFQALEQISDFTLGETPDVVYLHVDGLEAELALLENMLLASAGDFHASVIAYSAKGPIETSGLGNLASQLERLIPACSQAS